MEASTFTAVLLLSIIALSSGQMMPWSDWLWSRTSVRSDDTKAKETLAQQSPESCGKPAVPWDVSLNRTDWSHYTSPHAIIGGALFSAATLSLVYAYKTYVRRLPTVDYLKPSLFRRRSIYGYVASVGDGDNFHLYHMPGGRLLGWGWARGRRLADLEASAKGTKRKWWSGKTIHVRIAGIDAPELSHWGKDPQPYGQEALDWLRGQILNKHVRAYPYRRDQYDRVVSTVYQRRFVFFKSDIGYSMIKNGLATVYEAKFGSEFGDKEEEYRAAEASAKQKKIGMWQEPGLVGRLWGKKQSHETPREYKTRTAKEEKAKKAQTSDLAK